MSETSTPEERTEMPTERRMGQLRKDGSIHSSHEITQAASLLSGFYALTFVWPIFFQNFKVLFASVFREIRNPEPLQLENLYAGLLHVVLAFAPPLAAFVATIAVATTLSTMLQTKWNIKGQWIKFDLASLNPINGIRRIFSIQGFISTIKALVKLMLILPIAYFALRDEAEKMVQLMHTSLHDLFHFASTEMRQIFWRIMYVIIAVAIFDFVWGRYQWFKVNKMTKAEVKDERKAVEGDETVKRKIIAKGLQRIAQRIRQTVPKADVIITNPTHYSIALKYDRLTMKAPTVVAKGKGFMALRIREIAKEHGIPILERKPLARALYASVEVGREIPYELFKAVAEVLAYVYKLKNPRANRSASEPQPNQQTMRP